MAAHEKDKYKCYICDERYCEVNAALIHFLDTHEEHEHFSIKIKSLHERNGIMTYQAKHFHIRKCDLIEKKRKGLVPKINEENMKIVFKRCTDQTSHTCNSKSEEKGVDKNRQSFDDLGCQASNPNLSECIEEVIEKVKEMNRTEDFIGVLNAIRSGFLKDNIAFHLLLDIGRFYMQNEISQMRYSKATLDFWITIKHLFKGKGLSFFRGYKGCAAEESSSKSISPQACRINFVVPSDSILNKESSNFIQDSAQPGILKTSLESFSATNKGKDVKLSIDGKKLAIGLGKMGDKDLCGHEQKPTLLERKEKHESDINTVRSVKSLIELSNSDSLTCTNPNIDTEITRKAILITISNLSNRIKELREQIVKRETSVRNLTKQVEGDWRSCKVAPAISFNKTKILQCHSCIKDLLHSIDNLGFLVACMRDISMDKKKYS